MLTITMNIGVRPHNEHMSPCSVIKYVGTGTKLGSPNLKRRKEPRNSPGFGPKRATSSRPTRPTGQKHVKHSVRGARGACALHARSMRRARRPRASCGRQVQGLGAPVGASRGAAPRLHLRIRRGQRTRRPGGTAGRAPCAIWRGGPK